MPTSIYRFGEFRLDPRTRRLEIAGQTVALTAKSFDLLLILVEQAGCPVTKETLFARLWPDTVVEENNLTQQIFQLRRALGKANGGGQYILTLPKTGYQFVAEVASEAASEAVPETAPEPEPPAENRPDRPRGRRMRWLAGGIGLGLALAAGAMWLWARWLWAEGAPLDGVPPAVAVLPFENRTGDPANDPLLFGSAAEIVGALGQLEGLAAQSTPAAGGGDPARAARRLGAGYVVSGAFSGQDPLDIEVSLYDAGRDEVRWHKQFQFPRAGWAAANAEIASELLAVLEQSTGAPRRLRMGRKLPRHPEAYAAFLRGAQRLETRRAADLTAAEGDFEQAIVADAGYAGGYAGLAFTLLCEAIQGQRDPAPLWERAVRLADQALALDPEVVEARVVKMMALAYREQDEAGAEREARRLVAQYPANLFLQVYLGHHLTRTGKSAEAERVLRRAVQADPTSLWARQQLALHYYFSRQFGEGKKECLRMIRLHPSAYTGYAVLLAMLVAGGEYGYAERLVELARARGMQQPAIQMMAAYIYARRGEPAEARRIVEGLEGLARHTYLHPLQFAVVQESLGRREEALRLVERCREERCVPPSIFRLDPLLDSLRQDPRFVMASAPRSR